MTESGFGELDRRGFLRSVGLVGGGVAVGAAGGVIGGRASVHTAAAKTVQRTAETVPFYGPHQAGVVDRAPDTLRFTSYDLLDTSAATGKSTLATLLRALSGAAASMAAGKWISQQGKVADGLRPAGLTVTFGIGARAVTVAGRAVPGPLADIPAFAGETLDPRRSNGDLGIQVCADDPLLVASVARALTLVAAAQAKPRWIQNGFLPSGSASVKEGSTPRNLLGQLDGTDNPTGAAQQLAVWDTGSSAAWMNGGTYLVCRRIRMLLDNWAHLTDSAKSAVIGRDLESGAPLSGGVEHTVPDFTATSSAGTPLIATNAHVRLTNPANNGGATMLRRAYSYDDGLRADGTPDAGLFFQAFQTDPRSTFVEVQRKLVASDALSKFISHETSAVFAVLPGAASGSWVGQPLLEG